MKARLSQILPNLYATRAEFPLGGNVYQAQAFLIRREPHGKNENVWVYASSHVSDYLDHIQELGGVARQLLNHRDEASRFCNVLFLEQNAPVFCHAEEKQAIQQKGCDVGETFSGPVFKFHSSNSDDLVAYHTPGHAKGVTSYLWKNDKEGFSVLFTGDTLYRDEQGQYAHGPLQFHAYAGNREDMIRTLELYLEWKPTYVCSGLTASEFLTKFDRDQIGRLIDQLKSKK